MGDTVAQALSNPGMADAFGYFGNAATQFGNSRLPANRQQPLPFDPTTLLRQQYMTSQIAEANSQTKLREAEAARLAKVTAALMGGGGMPQPAGGFSPATVGDLSMMPGAHAEDFLTGGTTRFPPAVQPPPQTEMGANGIPRTLEFWAAVQKDPAAAMLDLHKTYNAPDYRERELNISGDRIQKQFSRNKGMTWENFGEPYDRREPWIPVEEYDATTQSMVRRLYPRPGFANVVANQGAGSGPGGAITLGGGKPTPERLKMDEAVKKLSTMQDNLDDYRATLKTYGTSPMAAAGMPPSGATDLQSKAEALRLDLKNLYELGALVGGDFAILDRMLADPGSMKGVKIGQEGLLKQLDNLETQLYRKLKEKGIEAPRRSADALKKRYDKMTDDEIRAELKRQGYNP